MTAPKKLKFKNPAGVHASGARAGKERKVTVPPGKRHTAPKVPQPGAATRKKKKKSGKGIVIAVFLAIAALVALFGIYKYAEIKRIEARIEAFALQGFRTTCDEQYALIAPLLSKTITLQEQAAEMIAEVEASVLFVTQSPLKREPKKEEATPDGSAPDSPAPAPKPAARAVRPPVPEEPSREAGHETSGGREAPAGIMSLADLEAKRAGKSAPPDATQEAGPKSDATQEAGPKSAATTDTQAPAARTRTTVRKPRIVVIGQQILGWQDTIATKIEGMHESELEADEIRDRAYEDPLSIQAAERVKAIEKVVGDIDSQHGTIAAMIVEMRKGAAEVAAIHAEVDAQRKAAAEEALRQRLERERAALVVSEKARAVESHKGIVEMLKRYSFTEALAELEFAKKNFKTDEGKADLQVYIDRCSRLCDLKNQLITRLNEQPFRWGWGLGSVTRDVLGADESTLNVHGEKVNWADVSLDQMKKLIDHYAKDAAARVSWRATMSFSTAILMHECDRTDDAAAYCAEASRLGSFLRNDIERLLPEYR